MALHRLTQVIIGVPNTDETAAYYSEFGLGTVPGTGRAEPATGTASARRADHVFTTTDGGEQLRIVHSPRRRVVRLGLGVENTDDLDRIAANLTKLGEEFHRHESAVTVTDPGTEVAVYIEVAPPLIQSPRQPPVYNAPGLVLRSGRADGIERSGPVLPRKLGHVVIGSVDQERSQRLFTEGLGFKISDLVIGRAAFLRCSSDHHNVLIQRAPVAFLHHTSWQVDDVDEIGRGATALLNKDPARHVWGLGRHHVGSNFFWYLKDPAGNFSEYYSDMDCIVDDQLWTPEILEGAKGLFNWGPPPPPSFLAPEDLGALMAGTHAPR